MLTLTGATLLRAMDTAGRAVQLLFISGWKAITLRRAWYQLAKQVDSAGIGSLLVLALIAGLTGMIMVMQTGPTLEPYGAIETLGPIIGATFMRELGPVWAAMIVLSRVGSAMAAELGTMVVNEEVEALEVMDVDPIRYLVVPRILALILVMPILALVSVLVGLAGGSLVAQAQFGLSYTEFFSGAANMLSWTDLVGCQIKALVFGLVIGVIACDQGLACTGGAEGVGRSTTASVRLSVIFVLVSDLIITSGLLMAERVLL